MSVDQLPPGKARSASREPQLVRYGEYVDQQIESTRKLVKFVDAMTVLLTITVGTILFLLTAAIVEHWLVPSGYNFAVRSLLFLLLVSSIGYFAVRRLWPLCVSSINPAYAAQAIEHDNPALKNSLLNLLLFRQNREQVTDAVYETLEEQAAKRLTRVPVESAVDRTQLLRLAYVLMVIVAIAAIYKIFSPKDPFVTAERVLLPWANVVPASRVSIENVEPGHVTLARGDVLNVSADVRGIGDDDPVIVKFTTADGQAVDRPAAMTPSAAGLRFTGQIPPADDASRTGVAQNLRYRIEAGDARSLEYSVTVIAAPTITIDRIDYDYPDYTRLADRSVERQGHISALEGTRITIFARANQSIKEASLDFEADGRRDATLQIDGTNARTGFELALRDDRRTPKFTSYVLRFTDVEGRSNHNPVKYPIEVEPDVAPEASVLAPKEKSRDVRLDETVTIEFDAIDSDYGLAEVRIHGEAAGRTVIDEKPLNKHHTGRFTARVRFTPIDHSLKPGDVVRYWVTARDDRPNETASDSQTLRITSPDPMQPRPDRLAQRDEPKPNNDSDQQGESGESGESGGAGTSDSSQGKQGEQQGESASADGQNGQPSEQNQSNQPGDQQSDEQSDQPGEQGNSQSAEGQSGSNESDGNQSGEQQGTEGQSGGKQSGSSDQQNEQQGEQSGDAQQQPGNSSGNSSGNSGSQNNSQQPSAGEQSGNESGQSGANNNPQSRPNPNSQPSGDQRNNGEQQPGESNAPVSSEGDNDGEAFERIQNFLERDGKLPDQSEAYEQESKDSQQDSKGESASADGQSGSNSVEQSSSPSDSNSEKGNNPAEGPGAQTQPGDNPEEAKDPADGKQPEDSQSPGGQQTSSKGESGAGEESQQNQGSPDSQPTTKPTEKPSDKWEQKPSSDKQGEQEPSSGGRGKQESDSQGNEGGDHTGGGEEGGGQKANRDGTGSSGQNQSADEGAGESSEQGQGNTSSNTGEDTKSESPTGESSKNQSGDGSSQRNGTGDEPGGESSNDNNSTPGEPASAGGQEDANNQPTPNNQPGDPQQNQQDKDNSEPSNSQEQLNNQQGAGDQSNSARGGEDDQARAQDSQSSQNSGSDAMSGAGQPPQGVIPPSKTDGPAPAADDANLDYARKRTDLVLETLAEQMKRRQVDKRLLDELGWTEADMKRFLDRWQQLKAAAQNDAAADDAQRELDDALRSLGLRRGALQQSKVSDDTDRDLRQGFRGPVPQEYQDRLKAYNQGVSRAREQGRE